MPVLARISIVLFAFSSMFPLVACFLSADAIPRWLGVADVVVAASLLVVMFRLVARTKGSILDVHRITAFEITHRILALIPALLVAYFALGERVNWTVLTIGLAWRSWLLIYCLPNLIAAHNGSAPETSD